ncbi:cytochrome ubiquinol oxidase subunit I [Paenibacillus sp. MER TA 81-3]|uniref:cytochrome ubiquinol oxidase subunit I n=1 Tax=Paenibacillus sp. MER TA 81-3 TaxID=2939573 RepID=UPI00203DA5CA|nr:cytochrome ubiquinol oxidase subunit I [Paenibacillus sp. MER TA 81-3]MCM3340466.1 cytochrome ubiquinol oxidase subunit I [Paenibacillus sp. MER TA 81-3]
MVHFLALIPVAIGSSASAFFITTVNAFMNAPRGFDMVEGQMTNIQPLLAMFNPAMPTKVSHVLVTAYVTSAFLLAAIAAIAMLRGRNHTYYKKALRLTMTSALVFALASALIGDLSGKYLHEYQPEKLAAAEWHFETTDKASLILGGILTEENEVKFAIKIPFALSILAGSTPDTVVKGLKEVPPDELPPLRPTHYFFDSIVFIGIYLTLVALWYVIWQRRKRKTGKPISRMLLWAIVIGAPLAVMAIESGWIFAEIGRQPWILWKVMTVAEGATTSNHVDTMLWLFALLYAVLTLTAIRVLIRMFKEILQKRKLLRSGLKEARRYELRTARNYGALDISVRLSHRGVD